MSRSRHTAPPRVTAAKRDGRPAGSRLRIIEGKPRPGDVHPIPKKLLSMILQFIPPEFTAGLLRVELRARAGDWGRPYAWYRPKERAVIIYSVPLLWTFQALPDYEQGSMESYGAAIERDVEGYRVEWASPSGLSMWFAQIILFHELGHHFAFRHERKYKLPVSRKEHEALADKYRLAIMRAFQARLDEGKARKAKASAEGPDGERDHDADPANHRQSGGPLARSGREGARGLPRSPRRG